MTSVEARTDAHFVRRKQLLKLHPEVRALEGSTPATCIPIAILSAAQLGIAIWLQSYPWWLMIAMAYTVGALLALGLWVMLHECSHDLVFRSPNANKWMGLIVGLPLIVPAASTFWKCHLLHHKYPGDLVLDGDIPSRWEVDLVGHGTLRKALWLASTPLLISLRPMRMGSVRIFDKWGVRNFAIQAIFTASFAVVFGLKGVVYLLFSNLFSLGLNPLGARWIQEHFRMTEQQETHSYYGIANRVVFNAGYHVEHHDMMRVPWMKLPLLRRMAPEFYSGLHSYKSWIALLFRFLFDPKIGLDRRIP